MSSVSVCLVVGDIEYCPQYDAELGSEMDRILAFGLKDGAGLMNAGQEVREPNIELERKQQEIQDLRLTIGQLQNKT